MNDWVNWGNKPPISAIILAAGISSRMGQPKLLMPWGNTTVIQKIVMVLKSSHLDEIIVVTGGAREQVEFVLSDADVKTVFNPHYATTTMVTSLQIGLKAVSEATVAALVVLGDQPQIEVEVVQKIIAVYLTSRADLVIPSYHRKRGHPWLVNRPLWSAILDLSTQQTLRDFILAQECRITYVPVENESILKDLDTYEDWLRENPLRSE